MDFENKLYSLIILHLLLGALAFYVPILFVVYPFIVFVFGLYYVIMSRNKNNEVLYFAAYFCGMECFLRMTQNLIFYETGKYGVLFFMLLGIILNNISKKALIYFLIILLFIPGIVFGLVNFSGDDNFKKEIIFNSLGPLTLSISAMYCFDKKIGMQQLKNIFLSMFFPLLSTLVFILLFTPADSRINTITESNFLTCGGYGPNQVSTVLGLAGFICFSLFLFFAKTFMNKIIYVSFCLIFSYRCLITFSRGGLLTELVLILSVLGLTYFKMNFKGKLKVQFIFFTFLIASILIFSYTIFQTNGMISNRYSGKNAIGVEKQDKFSGRADLAEAELEVFMKNPLLGAGIGHSKQARAALTGHEAASHNEITRLMAEQGLFGLIIIILLFFVPLVHFYINKNQIFLIPFFLFWFFTINHAAIRIAAPAFIYGLSLLKINFDEKT